MNTPCPKCKENYYWYLSKKPNEAIAKLVCKMCEHTLEVKI
jgi:transcription elongation factor Elf1